MDNRIYLSRRNLEVLLSKLDRKKSGEATACTIIKYRNEVDPPEYRQTMDECYVTSVEDEDMYAARQAGPMHPADDPLTRLQAN